MVIKTDCLQELSVTKLLGVAKNAKIDLRHPKACKSEPAALYKQYLIRSPAALDRLLLSESVALEENLEGALVPKVVGGRSCD
jgi:hypothetical protein